MAKKDEFPINVSDFLVDVSEFNVCEIGAYTMLLLTQWKNKSLPLELDRLAGIAGCTLEEFNAIWPAIKVKFREIDGRYINVRTETTRLSKQRKSFLSSESGISGQASKSKKSIKNIVFPWNTPRFTSHWDLWKQYKKETFRFKFKTALSEQLSLDSLRKLTESEDEAIYLIDYAISKQWQGIYVPSNHQFKNATTKTKSGGGYNPGALNNFNDLTNNTGM